MNPPKITKRPARVEVRLPQDLADQLWQQARVEGVPATRIVERALRAELARLASQEPAGGAEGV